MTTPSLQCHVRTTSTAQGAIFVAQETVHPSKWNPINDGLIRIDWDALHDRLKEVNSKKQKESQTP